MSTNKFKDTLRTIRWYFIPPVFCLGAAVVGTIISMMHVRAAITPYRTFNFVFLLLSMLWLPGSFLVNAVVAIFTKSWKVFLMNLLTTILLFIITFVTVGVIDGLAVSKCESKWDKYRKSLSIKDVSLTPKGIDPRGIKSPATLSFNLQSNLSEPISVDYHISVTGPEESKVLMGNTEEFPTFNQQINPGDNIKTVNMEALKFLEKDMFDENKERFLRIEVNSNYRNTGCYQEGGTEIIKHSVPVKI